MEKTSKIFNVIRYQTDTGNFYFEPLSPIKRNIENKNMSLRSLKKMIRNTVVPNQEIVGTNLNVNETKGRELSLEFKSCKESSNIVKRKRQGFSYQNRKKQKQTSITIAEQEFKKNVDDMPIYNCSVCSCTFFRKGLACIKQICTE